MTTDTRQLQIFDAKTRQYVPSAMPLYRGRELANGAPWRICKPERTLKPRYVVPRGNCQRTVADIQADYLRWAQSKGLPVVHAYSEKPPRNVQEQTTYHRVNAVTKPIFTGQIDYMTQAEHFAVEHTEDCEQLAIAA